MDVALRRAAIAVTLVLALSTLAAQTPTQQAQQSQQTETPPVTTGIVMGRTLDADTGKPLGGAVVSLSLSVSGLPLVLGQPPQAGSSRFPARVISDNEGRFVFHDLPKGAFLLAATKGGYPSSALGRNSAIDQASQTLVLAEGEKRGDLTLKFWKYASISGRVVDEAGEPVVGIQVRILKRATVGGRTMFTQSGNTTTTDDRGIYRTGTLQAGDYVVGVVMTQTTVPTSLQDAYQAASKSGAFTDFLREMDRSSGGIFDLGAGAAGRQFGSWQLTTPGDRQAIAPPSEGGRVFVYPSTYYPNAAVPSKAMLLTVASGEDRLGVDLHLRPVVTSRVSGTLVGPNGPEVHTTLMLVSTGIGDLQRDYDSASAQTSTDSTGAFLFLGVTPGPYVIRALKIPPRPVTPQSAGFSTVIQVGSSTISSSGGGPLAPPPIPPEPTYWASEPVTVGDTDVNGVNVALHTGARLSGRLQFEGAAEPPRADQLPLITVQIDQADGRFGAVNQSTITRGVVDTNAQFKTYQLPPGRYVVRSAGSSNLWTFKTATLGGRDITDSPLDLGTEDVTDIVLTFTDHPAELTGTARIMKADTTATVLLFPAATTLWTDHGPSPRRFRTSRVGTDNTFRIASVPPGEYFVVAIHSPVPAEWLDPKSLQKLSAMATRVTIAEGEKKSLTLETKEVR